ncbi:MAG: hypothetical protein Q8K65_04220 [Alphaproteobacteria bacterium]|nr:hypothetical protein [Alphaproteobacteria bacterium]
MSDSPLPPRQKPSKTEGQIAVGKIKVGLMDDLAAGDFDRSRARLRLGDPAITRAAVMQLGAPYLEAVKKSPKARLDSRRGTEAIKGFINEELRPLVAQQAKRPVYIKPKKKPSFLRSLARGAATVALAIGLATPMIIYHTDPVRSSEPVTMDVVQADISQLRSEFSRTSLGRDMLAMAAAHNIDIQYDNALIESTAAGTYSAGNKKVRMDPSQPMAEQVMYLAHELRHAWQDIVLGYGEMENRLLTPQQQWTLRRYLEADAFAFSAYFMAERMQELPGVPLPRGDREMGSARNLFAEFSSDDGLTHDEYRRFALERMFTFLDSYDENHLRLATEANQPLDTDIRFAEELMQRGDLEPAYHTMQGLAARMQGTPSAEAFSEYLRRFGGMSLAPEDQTTLQTPVAAPQSAATALSAETAVITNAVLPEKPNSASRQADIAVKLAAAENLHQDFRALAAVLTAYTRAELQLARLEGRPTSASRFYPVVNDGGNAQRHNGHGRDAPAQTHSGHGHNCEVHAPQNSTPNGNAPRPR